MANGGVEGLVGYARRNFMVPMPRFASWDAFNFWLEEQCRKRQADVLRGHEETIGQRLTRDMDALSVIAKQSPVGNGWRISPRRPSTPVTRQPGGSIRRRPLSAMRSIACRSTGALQDQ